MKSRLKFAFLSAVLIALELNLSAGESLYVSEADLSEIKAIFLTGDWKFKSGDSLVWADPEFDDSHWETMNHSVLKKDHMPENGWEGIGWFRFHLSIDSGLVGRDLGFRYRQMGAAEIYINGSLLARFGKVGENTEEEITTRVRDPIIVQFEKAENNVIAVRYSNHDLGNYQYFSSGGGFTLHLHEAEYAIDSRVGWALTYTYYKLMLFVTSLILALVHAIMFLYDPANRKNLPLIFLMLAFAFFSFIQFEGFEIINVQLYIVYQYLSVIGIILVFLLLLYNIYRIIYSRLIRPFYFFFLMGCLLIAWHLFKPDSFVQIFGYIFFLSVTIEIARVGIFKGIKGKSGEWIIGLGIALFLLSMVYQILLDLNILSFIGRQFIVYVYGMLAFLISISIYMGREFAHTNKKLREEIIHVKKLSDITLKQEQEAKQREIEKSLLEADNKRKTDELEQARRLQLSMLPQKVPEVREYIIHAAMRTASEVGGDYYDFKSGTDNTLTIAIGDATGHGLRAGTLVASVKSLFNAFSDKLDIKDFFNECSRIIKEMNLGNLFMAMSVIKLNGNKLEASNAGMPPILIHRSGNGNIEEIKIKGMPLGGPYNFEYEEVKTEIRSGDVIILMSDGLSELFNAEDELFGLERIKAAISSITDREPVGIIDSLFRSADEWMNGTPQKDDMTFVVIKVI